MTGQIGTPLYMAPELLRGDDEYTGQVDVYAFSMVAYEIVTGQKPFFDLKKKIPVTVYQFSAKVNNGLRPEFPESVPLKMQKLISRCWSMKT